jgi:hypothetical protein
MMIPDTLHGQAVTECNKWAVSTRVYGTAYVAIRLFLITFSAMVAAAKTLEFASIPRWAPVFALAVTIVTGIDTWLNPWKKWRGFMEDRDDLARLLDPIKRAQEAGDTGALSALGDKFAELQRRHREKNVY